MKKGLRIYGDPVLREQAVPVETVDDDLRQLAEDMLETMYAENGIGLAAEQVGRKESICVVDVPAEADVDRASGDRLNPDVAMPLVLINPELVETSAETDVAEEGCLSFPGIYVPVLRPAGATVKFLDLGGERRELSLKGLVARAVMHEMDHLNGVLLVDRMSQVKKIALRGRLKRMRKETQENLAG